MTPNPASKKPVLLVDMDGTLVDLLPAWLEHYEKMGGEHVPVSAVKKYNHEQFVRDEVLFWEALDAALFHAKPVEGAIEGLRILMPLYEVYIVTYCHSAAPYALETKRMWIKKFLPEFPIENMIFTGAKHMIMGDYFLEDHAPNIRAWKVRNPQGTGILVKANYNDGVPWTSVVALLSNAQWIRQLPREVNHLE